MSSLLKISDAASLALHAMVYLASHEDRPVSTGEIAEVFDISRAHLSKVMQWLSRDGLVDSIRGPKGGFVLGEDPEKITLLDVYESIEGPLEQTECLLETPVCGGCCILGDLLESVNDQVARRLGGTKLSDLAGVFAR